MIPESDDTGPLKQKNQMTPAKLAIQTKEYIFIFCWIKNFNFSYSKLRFML